MRWVLKSISWVLFVTWVLALLIIGNWLAFHHHNDETGHRLGPLFIISMIASRGVIWLLDKAADRL